MLAMIGGIGSALGGLFGAGQGMANSQAIGDMMEYNPGGFAGPGGHGTFSGGTFYGREDPNTAARRAAMQQNFMGGMGGGFFQNEGFQNAFGQASQGMGGDFQNAQNLQSMMMGPQAFGGLGEQTGNMFSQGMSNLQRAGDVSGLVNQNLEASRALAQPFETQQRNNFFDTEFGKTMGATSGAGNRGMNFAAAQSEADNRRIMNAQTLGANQQQFLGNLGMQQMGQGFAGEGQGFQQMLSSLQQNQGAGQQRLQNALGLFGMGNDLQQGGFNQALQSEGMLRGRDDFMVNLMNSLAGNESNRIGAQSGGMNAMTNASNQSSGGIMGAIGGIMDIF